MLTLCLDGQGGFDWSGLAALKTHVSLREALEIEAVKCAAGDSRHDFQDWYSHTYLPNRRSRSQDLSQLGALDSNRVREEMAMLHQAIAEHEQLIAEHRRALLAGEPSPLGNDADATFELLEQLKGMLPFVQDEYVRLAGGEDES